MQLVHSGRNRISFLVHVKVSQVQPERNLERNHGHFSDWRKNAACVKFNDFTPVWGAHSSISQPSWLQVLEKWNRWYKKEQDSSSMCLWPVWPNTQRPNGIRFFRLQWNHSSCRDQSVAWRTKHCLSSGLWAVMKDKAAVKRFRWQYKRLSDTLLSLVKSHSLDQESTCWGKSLN